MTAFVRGDVLLATPLMAAGFFFTRRSLPLDLLTITTPLVEIDFRNCTVSKTGESRVMFPQSAWTFA